MVDMVKVLVAKKEAVYGTDVAPTVGANAIITRNFSSKAVEVDRLNRNLDSGSFGATPDAPSNERQTLAYEVEMAGSGAAGTAPAWMELLEACGMVAPTLTEDTDAVQRFAAASAAKSSLTQHHWIGDQRRKAVGCRGNFSINWTANAYPFIQFNFIGMIPEATPFDVNVPGAADISRWIEPFEVNKANSLLTLDGFACITRSLQIDANIDLTMRSLIGSRYVHLGNHRATGRLSVEAPSIATKDYLDALRKGDRIALAAANGTVAGNIVELGCEKTQILDITDREENGKLMWDMDLLLTVNAGQDDLIITAK